jgi:hypothetical protein
VQVAQLDLQSTLLSVQAAMNAPDKQEFMDAASLPFENRREFDAALTAAPVPESESDRIRRELRLA